VAGAVIETQRLLLRNWREADVAPFLAYTNTPAVMRWLGGVTPEPEASARVTGRLMLWQEQRGFTFWAVERKADGALLGFCGIKLADTPGSPVEGEYEVGWRLREDAWGKGYAKESAVASLDFAFTKLGASRVVAITCLENEPSWGLMERIGMTRRHALDHHDSRFPDFDPAIVYDIRPGELRR
jgi:RimJ/RimL family protein N-acetyltransferase